MTAEAIPPVCTELRSLGEQVELASGRLAEIARTLGEVPGADEAQEAESHLRLAVRLLGESADLYLRHDQSLAPPDAVL
jgi:hypothetical protein